MKLTYKNKIKTIFPVNYQIVFNNWKNKVNHMQYEKKLIDISIFKD